VKPDEPEKKLPAFETPKPSIKPDQILIAEFNYISQVAFQANEDRARVTSFYLISVGSFIAAILSTQILANPQPVVYWGFAGLFLFLALLAVTTILQLIRLRRSWYDCIRALNHIKNFYTRNVKTVDLKDAFHWKVDSLPTINKANSLSFYLVMEVGLFGSASLGAAYYFALLGLGWVSWGPALLLGGGYFVGVVYFYRRLLG
jgi:hypothetical protein